MNSWNSCHSWHLLEITERFLICIYRVHSILPFSLVPIHFPFHSISANSHLYMCYIKCHVNMGNFIGIVIRAKMVSSENAGDNNFQPKRNQNSNKAPSTLLLWWLFFRKTHKLYTNRKNDTTQIIFDRFVCNHNNK